MFKETDSKRSTLYAGFAGLAALGLLTACGGGSEPEEEPASPGVQEDPAQDPSMEESPMESPMEESPMEESPAEEGTDIEGAGEDNTTSTVGLAGTAVSWAL